MNLLLSGQPRDGRASTDGPFADLLALLVGWFANFESQRRSERIKAGLERRKAQGPHMGRKAGARDKGRRRRSGYYKRWENAISPEMR